MEREVYMYSCRNYCISTLKACPRLVRFETGLHCSIAVRRRAADILLTPPPPIVTDRRVAAAAADHMSASRRRRFRGVLTSCRTPAIMWLDFCNAVYTETRTFTKTERTMRSCFAIAFDIQMKHGSVEAKCFRGRFCENES